MKIAICYGNKAVLRELKYYIYDYSEDMNIEILADCYYTGDILLSDKIHYDLIFLGYKLIGENGFEIAKRVRKTNQEIKIVFVSDNTDFVFKSFDVQPFGFLVLPVNKESIYSVLNKFLEKRGDDYPIILKNRVSTMFITAAKIVYLEADNKHCKVHLYKDTFIHNETMAKTFEDFPKYKFIKINRAFIVNYDFITRFDNDMVYLKNKEALHITRKYLKSFKEEFARITNLKKNSTYKNF